MIAAHVAVRKLQNRTARQEHLSMFCEFIVADSVEVGRRAEGSDSSQCELCQWLAASHF